jgi:hypothetical protein
LSSRPERRDLQFHSPAQRILRMQRALSHLPCPVRSDVYLSEVLSIHIANATQRANPGFVIPTEAQWSGGICSSTLGRNESCECNEPFPICPAPLGRMYIFPKFFPSISPMQLKEPTLDLSSRPKRSGAEGSAVPLSHATNLANATNHFPFAPNDWGRLIPVSEFEWKKQNPPLAEG